MSYAPGQIKGYPLPYDDPYGPKSVPRTPPPQGQPYDMGGKPSQPRAPRPMPLQAPQWPMQGQGFRPQNPWDEAYGQMPARRQRRQPQQPVIDYFNPYPRG